jgi:hypothetical protein
MTEEQRIIQRLADLKRMQELLDEALKRPPPPPTKN